MCDCYSHKCNNTRCREKIDMHLEDFNTGRDEIEVYCGEHIPGDKSDGVLWEFHDDEPDGWGGTIFVKCLTDNARHHWRGNHYNGDCEAVIVFGKKEN